MPLPVVTWRVHLVPEDLASYRNLADSMYRIMNKKSYRETLEELQESETRLSGNVRGVMTPLIFPSMSNALRAVMDGEAAHGLAQLGAAVTAYRLEKGSYPNNISQLRPDYIREIPIDPYSGRPLAMVAVEDGMVLNSIAQNGMNAGGGQGRVSTGGWSGTTFFVGNAYRECRLKPAIERREKSSARQAAGKAGAGK
jgi:hypothetical protein